MKTTPLQITNKLDKLGASSSSLCAVHCALMPIVITFLPLIGLGWLASGWVEWALFTSSAVLGTSSLCLGYRQHGNKVALRTLAIGLSVLALGRLGDMHHWAPYYAALLVVGGFTVAGSHYINHRLCHSCHSCHPCENHN